MSATGNAVGNATYRVIVVCGAGMRYQQIHNSNATLEFGFLARDGDNLAHF
jgi:hypothetical protein